MTRCETLNRDVEAGKLMCPCQAQAGLSLWRSPLPISGEAEMPGTNPVPRGLLATHTAHKRPVPVTATSCLCMGLCVLEDFKTVFLT